jgi:hypothetical protein
VDAAPVPDFAANAVRLQLHALAYNLGNFLRTLATPDQMKDWSLTSLREKLIKSARSLLVMAATLHSRWPRLLSRGTSSQNFSDRSPICVRHRLACRHDAPGYRSTSQTAERCVLTSPASAPMPRNVRQGPSAGTEAAMAITGSAATTGKATWMRRCRPIRWIPAKMRRRS